MADAWTAQLRTASWRGIPFLVEADDADFGRRVVVREYPARDLPTTQDLGRRARSYTVDAYLLGEDFGRRRDRLIEACEESGPGVLVHPRYGIQRVVCTGLRVRHSRDEGRMARLSISFSEAGDTALPAILEDLAGSSVAQAYRAVDAAVDEFLSVWNLEGAPGYVLAAAETLVADVSGWMTGLAAPFLPGGALDTIAGFGEDAVTLVTTPQALADGIAGTMVALFSPEATFLPEQVSAQASTLGEYGSNTGGDADSTVPETLPVDDSTPDGLTQADNQAALGRLVRAAAAASAAAAAAIATYEYQEQAIETARTIAALLDVAAAEATDDTAFEELSAARRSLLEAVPGDRDLPTLQTVRLLVDTPALVIASQLYDDADRADQIIRRNAVHHPLFVPGGDDLQVLSR